MFWVTRNKIRIGDFSKEQDAIHFIMEKLREDRHFNSKTTYSLHEGADLLKEYSQDDLAKPTQDAEESSGASQKGSGKSFAPTPFSTAPRLGPQTWIKDDSDSKEDDDNKK